MAEKGTFLERTEVLEEMVGDDHLSGTFAVEKVYAAVQHEKGWLNYLGFMGPKAIKRYHRGGGPKFVEAPLKENYPAYFQNLADGVLDGTLRVRMVENMKDLDHELQFRAPERDRELKRAGSYTVRDGGLVFARQNPKTAYEDENPGDPPGYVIHWMKEAGRL